MMKKREWKYELFFSTPEKTLAISAKTLAKTVKKYRCGPA